MRALRNLTGLAKIHLQQTHRAVTPSCKTYIHLRAFSATPYQSESHGQTDKAWTQSLLRLGLGLGAAAGVFTACAGLQSSDCEQQASAGQTKVSSDSG